jgi:predicted RNA-binding Zn ribbon-like protein
MSRPVSAISGHSGPALHRNKESPPRLSGRIQAFEKGTPCEIRYGRALELLIARNDRREVRECKGDNCGWLFLDRSKGGHRMWCSDASCGARSRIARFRTRLKPKIEDF